MRLALLVLLGWSILPEVCVAQRVTVPRGRSASTTGSVQGVVFDSVVNTPLYGALVQLVGEDNNLAAFGKTVVSDGRGRFQFVDVPIGRYTLGFYHAMLDSLGVEPTLRAVVVESGRSVAADLAIAPAERLRRAMCGGASGSKPPALVMGFVRDARAREPLAGVTVVAEWVELNIGRQGVTRRAPRRTTTTGKNGWYAICEVPGPGAVKVTAYRGVDSTDVVDLDVPDNGFLRRELFLGTARIVDAVDSMNTVNSTTPPRRSRIGTGVVRGTVTSAVGGRPLAGAQVGMPNGPLTRSNERGEWTLSTAPTGTRVLEVRAVGYYPSRQVVDVVDGIAPVATQLVTFKSVLDTMKVIANYNRYANLQGFRERSKTGLGRFLTEDDVARRKPLVTSDLFTGILGVFLDSPRGTEQNIYMRGVFEDRCIPTVYLNGSEMGKLTANDIDAFVSPDRILGIEVYRESQAPGQFVPPMSGCGSIVVWTK